MRTLQAVAILFVSGCWFPLDDSDTKTPENEAPTVASGLRGQGIVGAWLYTYQSGCALVFFFDPDQSWFYQKLCRIEGRVNHVAAETAFGVYVYASGELELFTTEATCAGAAPYDKVTASIISRGTQLGLWFEGAVLIFERVDLEALSSGVMPQTPSTTAILGCFENNGWFQPGPLTRI